VAQPARLWSFFLFRKRRNKQVHVIRHHNGLMDNVAMAMPVPQVLDDDVTRSRRQL